MWWEGRLIGEHVYVHDAATEVREIPEHEYISIDEARDKLLPLLRPLPELRPASSSIDRRR